jgi:hypothetical protein
VHDGICFSPCAIGNSFTCEEVVPATKEQRKILFEERTAAGGVLHFNKKELKKIDNETEITIDAKIGAKDSELQEDTYYIPKGFHAEIDGDKVVIKKGEKPIWSEMDEEILQWVVSDVKRLENDCKKANAISDKELTWLKSLKGRVGCEANCTTTKEWSVEDMSKIQRICKYLDEAKKYYADITEVRECMDWLKSLKEREQPHPKQEWSKEDDRMLNVIIADLIGFSHSNTSTLESHFNGCIDWLKSIKDRYI